MNNSGISSKYLSNLTSGFMLSYSPEYGNFMTSNLAITYYNNDSQIWSSSAYSPWSGFSSFKDLSYHNDSKNMSVNIMLEISRNTYSYGNLNLNISDEKYYLLRLNYSEDYDEDNLANEIDEDDDDDTINDNIDNCRLGLSYISSTNNDRDNDGCRDSDEDVDDDGDGLNDTLDSCPTGTLYWNRNSTTDYDDDGCNDASEDFNDDNDAYQDYEDMCPRLSGTSNYTGELGCPDSDGDGRANLTDPFPNGFLGMERH